jgi:dTMP kinase
LDLAFIRSLNQFVVNACHPDLTFLLDLEVEESRVRLMRRVRPVGGEDRIEKLTKDFFERVRRGYLEIARLEPGRVKVIDASRTEDEVEEAIWKEIDGLLN